MLSAARRTLLPAFTAFFLVLCSRCACASANAPAKPMCQAIARKPGAPVLDRYTVLRIDSELSQLTLDGAHQPAADLPVARALVSEIQGVPNPRLRALLEARLSRVYIALNRSEAEDWLAALPSRAKQPTYDDFKAEPFNAALGAIDGTPTFRIELIQRGLASGAYQIASIPSLLQQLRKADPLDAAVLFHQVVTVFPSGAPTDRDVRFLLQVAPLMAQTDPVDAMQAVRVMLAALNSSDFHSMPMPQQSKLLPAVLLKDRKASLKTQVLRFATTLYMDVSGVDALSSRKSLQPSQLPNFMNSGQPSAEYQNAIRALGGAASQSQVLQLANSISDADERAKFFRVVLARVQKEPGSVVGLAESILNAAARSNDPTLALSLPRMVLHSALAAHDAGTAELSLIYLQNIAKDQCKDSGIDASEAGYSRGAACMQEYADIAEEIARSPMRPNLQISDPSLLQRLQSKTVCQPAS